MIPQLETQSGKLAFLMPLLAELQQTGHRVLIFSLSSRMLDIIEVLIRQRYSYVRLDGSVASMSDREDIISRFRTDNSVFCFLLTTQVGGLGLTLTEADRVVVGKWSSPV